MTLKILNIATRFCKSATGFRQVITIRSIATMSNRIKKVAIVGVRRSQQLSIQQIKLTIMRLLVVSAEHLQQR